MSKEKYDFNFITLSLGLVPIQDGKAAINPSAITHLQWNAAHGTWEMGMHGGTTYVITVADMAELEETIKRRGEEAKIIQKEAMRHQIVTQNEIIQELNRGVQGALITGAVPNLNKKGRN